MSKIKKAVITAAGAGQQTLALQTLVDRDGTSKSALRIILEEAAEAGVDEVGVVIFPGTKASFKNAAGDFAGRLTFIEQPALRGYGHALHCARDFVGNESFLHLVGDHLYVSREKRGCAKQLVEAASTEACAVSAVQATRERMLPFYGAVGGKRVVGPKNLYEIEAVLEKPTPTDAEQHLAIPGLRAGHYLCFFGIHVLTPTVFQVLDAAVHEADGGDVSRKIQLSPALARLAAQERYLAVELSGVRYDIGVPYGLLIAQLALGLEGKDRSEILAQLVELLASRAAG